jgi:hypothetical protein
MGPTVFFLRHMWSLRDDALRLFTSSTLFPLSLSLCLCLCLCLSVLSSRHRKRCQAARENLPPISVRGVSGFCVARWRGQIAHAIREMSDSNNLKQVLDIVKGLEVQLQRQNMLRVQAANRERLMCVTSAPTSQISTHLCETGSPGGSLGSTTRRAIPSLSTAPR